MPADPSYTPDPAEVARYNAIYGTKPADLLGGTCPAPEPDPADPYTDPADVELVARALATHRCDSDIFDKFSGSHWDTQRDLYRDDARAALAALSAARRLQPAGGETFEEWRITGQPGNGYPPYEFVWSSLLNPHLGPNAEQSARRFVESALSGPDRSGGIRARWVDGPHLSRRIVTVGPWLSTPTTDKEN